MDNDLYEAWLKFLFDRPEASDGDEWYWDRSLLEFAATPEQQVSLIGKTFENSGKDLLKYSDLQISNGLKYIFDNGVSDTIFLITQKGVSEEQRVDAVLKMKYLYRNCFAKRCSPVLSHLSEPAASPLWYICYMLWDISPLGRWKDTILDVMEDALYLSNNACIESGLHGLGHGAYQYKQQVPIIIDRFLSKTKSLRPELRQYALDAKTGRVQ